MIAVDRFETARLRAVPTGPEHQSGAELGGEALAPALGLVDVVSFTMPSNNASRNVMEQLGFA